MNKTKIRSSDIHLGNALDFAAQKKSISPPKIANNVVNRQLYIPQVNTNPYVQPRGNFYGNPRGNFYGNPHGYFYGRQQILNGPPYMQHIPLIQLRNNKLLHHQCRQLGYTINDDFSRYYDVNPQLNKAFVPYAPVLLKPKKVSQIPLPSSHQSYPIPSPPPSSPKSSSVKSSSPKSLSKQSSHNTVNRSTMTFVGASPSKKKMPSKKKIPSKKKMPSKKMLSKKMPSKKKMP